MIDTQGGHEIELLESLEISEAYGLVMNRIIEEIERKRNELERSEASERGIAFVQGAISGLRTVLEIPGILRAEIQAQMKE